jgi:hypothetical protein
MAVIIKIAKNMETNGHERKSSGPSQQSGLSQIISSTKIHKKFGHQYQHKRQTISTTSSYFNNQTQVQD